MSACERCGFTPEGWDLLDYCSECFANLCGDCMSKGCCGHVPAYSGMDEDEMDEEELDG